MNREVLEIAIEALEYYKKINYCWSASEHPRYVKCVAAIEQLKEELERVLGLSETALN